MKIFENISNGYKRVATGIAIVSFLAIMYLALIPGGSMASLNTVMAASGTPIAGAFVKIMDWPQYNATTDSNGNYTMPNVPYGTYGISAQAEGYTKNVSTINVDSSTVNKDFYLAEGSITGDYRYYSLTDMEIASNKISTLSDVNTNFIIPQYGDGIYWDTEVYVTDASGQGATLTLDYYNSDGSLNKTENPTIPANGTYKWIPSDGTNGRPTTGMLKINSTRNVVGEFKIYSKSTTDMISSKLYSSADMGLSFVIPQYGDGIFWGTWVAISDVSGIDNNVTLKYYYSNGTAGPIETQSIPKNGMYTFIASDGTNGRPQTGKLEITSDSPITGEYRIFSLTNAGILSNKLYTSADMKKLFTIPQYGDGMFWHTWIAISDVSGLGANLTIDYYYPNGTLAVTETPPMIPANGMYTVIPTDGANGRPSTGKLSISADNSVAGEIRIFSMTGRGIMANSLFTQLDVSNIVIVPYIGNNTNFNTYLSLADTSSYDNLIRVEYHTLSGGLPVKTETLTIPADGLLAWIVSDGTGGRPTQGNMFIYKI